MLKAEFMVDTQSKVGASTSNPPTSRKLRIPGKHAVAFTTPRPDTRTGVLQSGGSERMRVEGDDM